MRNFLIKVENSANERTVENTARMNSCAENQNVVAFENNHFRIQSKYICSF